MIEILEFVFSSFWIWLGFAILLGIVTQGAWRLVWSVIDKVGSSG